ncbi:MAG: hypothetical protein QT02_C0006G0012 [archaeon GW2011_AR9]|nr:MAG: hypothetical protein QT02_C0006G0012 [archaeon GW2011_AR9]MBS3120471.1 hypothetical protein [Candidatus Woesearchaeota archaeon]HIG92643.1 hypothetical protein [Candidatus Woesearchaeota archaeon]HIH12282.1 hypothetical protein [Candidatus Woesearchaeota archaeon]
MRKVIQKIVALAALMIFIISIVPLAAAEEGETEVQAGVEIDTETSDSETTADARTSESNSGSMKDAREKLREKRQELVNDFKEKAAETRDEFKMKVREEAQGQREGQRDKVIELRGKLQNLREQYIEVKMKHKEDKKDWQEHEKTVADLKKSSRNCKDDSQECHKKKDDLKRGVKQHLLKTVELIDDSLERLTNRVEASMVLSDDDKAQALASLVELEASLTIQKEQVQALAENATNEELRKAIQDLKHTWQDVQKEQRRIISGLIHHQLENVVEKHAEYGNAMKMRIDELTAKGVDTTELKALYDNFLQQLETLKEKEASAREKWLQAKTDSSKLEEWKEAQQEVREELAKAKEILREFMTKFRELKGTSVEAETSTEAETPAPEAGSDTSASTETTAE